MDHVPGTGPHRVGMVTPSVESLHNPTQFGFDSTLDAVSRHCEKKLRCPIQSCLDAIKHVIVLSLLQDLASGKVFSTKAIEKALGRIQWATATCPLAKPFLQPFWQWKSACKNAGQPGKLVRCLAVLLSELFSRQFPQMSPFCPWSDWTGASDASAEPFQTTWIGGWLSDLNTPTKDQVYWFQYQLTQASHPWAFKKGDPQKRITAIELYGTLFLVLLLMSKQPTAACRLHIPLISDNQGNVYSILNNETLPLYFLNSP